jgi:hypothetical protein
MMKIQRVVSCIAAAAALGCSAAATPSTDPAPSARAGGSAPPGEAGSPADLSSLVNFDDVRTAGSNPNWLTDPRIAVEKTGVSSNDMVGSWGWATGQTAEAFVDGSGNITGTKGNGAYVVFDFFASGAYRVRIFTVLQTGGCQSIAKEVQVGTFTVSGANVQLHGVYRELVSSICGAAWTSKDYPPKDLAYEVTAAQFVDGFTHAAGVGGVLHGPCAGLDQCYSGYADSSITSAAGYNLQAP